MVTSVIMKPTCLMFDGQHVGSGFTLPIFFQIFQGSDYNSECSVCKARHFLAE